MFTLSYLGSIPVYRLEMPTELVTTVQDEAEEQFARFMEISKNYEPLKEGSSYRFRSPQSLTDESPGPGYQWGIESSESNKTLRAYVVSEAEKTLGVSFRVHDDWFLMQKDLAWIDNPYHTHDTSDWTLVNYIKANQGDSISLKEDSGEEHTVPVEQGLALLFPSSTLHKPDQNTANGNRISLNMELAEAAPN